MATDPQNDNAELSDVDVERIADAVFHKLLRRLAKVAAVGETVAPKAACAASAPQVKPSAAAIERERARRARKGVL